MASSYGNRQFFTSTRGQIVMLLRRAGRTVNELAQALGLTDNAVRAHLATLERDGLVQQRNTRQRSHHGAGKPSYIYDLTPAADHLFPKAYGSLLHHLLDVLAERIAPAELEALLRAVGHHIAASCNIPSGNLHTRLTAAVDVLNGLGGLAELDEQHGIVMIRGYSCPFASVVPDHPEVCRLAETLLTELIGVPVHEQCDRHKPPRCHFELLAV